MIGAAHKQAIVTLVERKSGFAVLAKVSIPAFKSTALGLFYVLLDAGVKEYPIQPKDFAREYAETIFAMPVLSMAKDF